MLYIHVNNSLILVICKFSTRPFSWASSSADRTFCSEHKSPRFVTDGADQVFLVVRAIKRNGHDVHSRHNASDDDGIGLHFVPEEYLVAGLVVSRAAVVQRGGKSHVGVIDWRDLAVAVIQVHWVQVAQQDMIPVQWYLNVRFAALDGHSGLWNDHITTIINNTILII